MRVTYRPLLWALTFIVGQLYAGDTTQTKQFNRVYFGPTFTPGISYRLLTSDKPNATGFDNAKSFIKELNRHEKPTFSYSVGVKAGVQLKKFLAFETGIEYTSIAYEYNRKDLTFNSGYRPDLTYDPSMYGSIKSTVGFHYLKVPLALNFSFGKGKVKGIVNTGANLDFLIGRWQRLQWNIPGDSQGSNNLSDTKIGSLSRFNISPFLGIGFDYHINQLLTLRVMPIAQIQALNIAGSSAIAERQWLAGINVSLLFGFKKVSLK